MPDPSYVIGTAGRTMGLSFHLDTVALEGRFLERSAAEGFIGLAGHRATGGMRASIYNAVSETAVDALVDFMNDFRIAHG